jgi:8-oxo-dGTP diphosphatase
VVEVAAGLIQNDAGEYLIARRRPGSHLEGLWEFPGGKRGPGESLGQCLRRELAEELGASFAVGELVDTVRWEYPERTVIIHFFRCRLEAGQLEPREGQEIAWVSADRLAAYAFPPADAALLSRLGRRPAPRPSPDSSAQPGGAATGEW